MYPRHKTSEGFTVIELTLAMGFLTFILVFVVVALTQLLGVYNKGLTVKAINQSGRSISSEIQRSVRDAAADAVNTNRLATGRFCTGKYSYVWSTDNSGVASATSSSSFDNYFASGAGVGRTLINFARIYDIGGSVCTTPGDIASSLRAQSTDMISSRLQVRSLQVTRSAPPNEGMFIIRYIITSQDPSGLKYVDTSGSLTDSDYVCQGGNGVGDQFCASSLFVVYAYAKN